ncbi:MAG: CRISPR-associated ring nuclease Csm6 [Mariprofundaceae bacterium]|nr:CRISPR-associated ring nuclease Csm6 [Mariprofundaceae bacterium]
MKKILLIASSLLPQVITETFYALVRRQESFIPDEIHVITTEEGLQHLRSSLWSEGRNIFAELCDDLGLDVDKVRFDMSTIHLMERSKLASPQAHTFGLNDTCEDFIVSVVRQLTLDEQSVIHASIAGGRKNTGFYLGYAMSLFGRDRDELSHVLIPVAFECNANFFYPPKEPKRVLDGDNKTLSTQDASVCLVDIPFVRLSRGMPQRLFKDDSSFSDVVAQAQHALAPAHVRIELKKRRLICGGVVVQLSPSLVAWYAWFASICRQGAKQGLHWHYHTEEDYLYWLAKVTSKANGNYIRTEESLKNGLKKSLFLERNSKIRKKLEQHLNDAAEHYMIHRIGGRPKTRYCLNLPAHAIEIVEG